MKNTYSQVRLIAFALFFLTLLTTNSCRKDKSAIIENTQALVDRLDSKERIQTSEISIWLKNNLDSVMLKDVHLSVTEQNVIGGHHLIRVSIGLDAALYFVKSGGELNVWAYKWLDKQPGAKTFTGNVVSYSFKDGQVMALVYEKGQVVKWGTVNAGSLKQIRVSSSKYRLASGGILGHFWCWLTGGDWTPGNIIQSGYCSYYPSGTVYSKIMQFLGDLFGGEPSGNDYDGGGTSGISGVLFGNGSPPANPENQGTAISPGGNSTYIPSYGGGDLWVSKWVPEPCNVAPSTDDPNGGGGGEIGYTHPGNCQNGHWESVQITIDSPAYLLINKLEITITGQQVFLNNNLDIAEELYVYLLDHGNTTENLDFLTWAVEYLYANPTVSLEVFRNQYLSTTEGTEEGEASEYDENFWNNPALAFPNQILPTFQAFKMPILNILIPYTTLHLSYMLS